MANTTPFDFTKRGYAIGKDSTATVPVPSTTVYPHSQIVNNSPVRVVSAYFSAADINAALTKMIGSATALAQGDVVKLITLPAGAFILNVTSKVVTAQGGACTISLGTTAGAADFCATSIDINAAVGTVTNSHGLATCPAIYGQYIATATTLDAKVVSAGAPTIAVVKVSVTYIMSEPFGS